jgi:hypothetical protein
MIPSTVSKRVFNATCAIGIVSDPNADGAHMSEDFETYGTGFLIRHDAVVTNRHVIQGIAKGLEKRNLDGNHLGVQFTYHVGRNMERKHFQITHAAPSMNDPFDVAPLKLKIHKGDLSKWARIVKPLSLIDKAGKIKLGEPVGVMGFPYGNAILGHCTGNEAGLWRVGPVLQQGFISGFEPWNFGNEFLGLLLDVRTYKGMSGSAVFRQRSGEVIGLHCRGKYQKVGDVGVPHSIVSWAIPIDRVRVAKWLEALDSGNESFDCTIKY